MKGVLFVLAVFSVVYNYGIKDKEPADVSQSGSLNPKLRKTFIDACTVEVGEVLGEDKSDALCSCMYDKGSAQWDQLDFMQKAKEWGPKIKKINVECLQMVLGAEAPDESSDPAPAEAASGNDQIRSSFLEGCEEPLAKKIGAEKARTICACVYDKGTAKWGLDDFIKKAMKQGDSIQTLAMECATGTL